MKQFKSISVLLLRIAVSLLSLGLVFYSARGRFTEAMGYITKINFWLLGIALALNFVSIFPISFRLCRILAIQNVSIPFFRCYYLWTVSLFFNLFLPSAVGGDVARAYYIYKDSGKKMAAASSVLLDRFFGLIAAVSIGFTAFTVARNQISDPRIGRFLSIFVGVVFVAVCFVMSRRVGKFVRKFLLTFSPKRFQEQLKKIFSALDLYGQRRLDFFIAYGYSLIAQGIFIFLVYVLARSIGIDLPISVFFLFMPIVAVVSLAPSIGGLGVREAATVYLFRKYISLDQAVALSLVFDLFTYGIGALCGILYAIRGGASIREIEGIEKSV